MTISRTNRITLLTLSLAVISESALALPPYISTPIGNQIKCLSVITDPTAPVTVQFDVADPDIPPGDPLLSGLTVIATSFVPGVVPDDTAHRTVAPVDPLNPARRVLTLTPVAFGTAAIGLRVTDGTDFSIPLIFSVGWPSNTPPTLADIADHTTCSANPAILLTVGDAQTPVANLTVTAVAEPQAGDNMNLLQGGLGNVPTAYIPYLPPLSVWAVRPVIQSSQSGTIHIRVTVTDPAPCSMSVSKTFLLTVQPNSLPTINVITPPPAYVMPGNDYVVDFSANDTDPTPVPLIGAANSSGVVTLGTPPPAPLTRGVTYSMTLHISPLAVRGQTGTATLTVADDCGFVSRLFSVIVDGDPDEDGVNDSVENGAPDTSAAGGLPSGDGNADGIPDRDQNNVTSLRTHDGSYVTVEAGIPPPTIRLANVRIIPPEDPALSPLSEAAGVSFPHGLVGFRVENLGGATLAKVTLTFHSVAPDPLVYYKYRPTVPSLTPFAGGDVLFENTPGPPYKVKLNLVDNGPYDLNPAFGVIEDPSGPALIARPSLNISLLSATQAQISWPVADFGSVLQYATNLVSPITWLTDTNTVVTSGPLKIVTTNLEPGQRFYRLGPP